MNSVHIIGRITKDLEVKATPTGKSVLNFTVAIPRFRKDDGADFANCVAWNKTSENMGRYLKKGDRISVTGKLQSRTYEDKDKKKIYVTETLRKKWNSLNRNGRKIRQKQFRQRMDLRM